MARGEVKGARPAASSESPSERPNKIPKPCKAIRQTARDLRRLDDDVEKCALAIGSRFGEVDETLVRMADDLMATTRRWTKELQEYMDERAADGETWEL